MNSYKFIKVIIFYLLLPCSLAFSQNIYKWQDANGKIHYSSEPQNEGQKPADLPSVSKENLERKISRIKAETPVNCEKHGGVDCSKGEDIDGSVICLDNFREAVLSFNTSCKEAKLQVSLEILTNSPEQKFKYSRSLNNELRKKGLIENGLYTGVSGLQLTVRNLSAIKANGINASFIILGSTKSPLVATGQNTIEPYGLEEYVVMLDTVGLVLTPLQLQELSYKISCENCPGAK